MSAAVTSPATMLLSTTPIWMFVEVAPAANATDAGNTSCPGRSVASVIACAVSVAPFREMVTLCAASGYVVHLFPTGQGNVIGNPIIPVIKLCANPRTVRTMSEHVDYDCSGLLQREKNLDQTGDELIEVMLRTCNGRLTAAEALGHREFVLTRLNESA